MLKKMTSSIGVKAVRMSSARHQRGLSLIGLFLVGIIVVALIALGFRVVPAVVEYIPYGKRVGTRERDEAMHHWLAGHGYAAVRIDRIARLPQVQEVSQHVTLWQPPHGGHVGFPGGGWPGHVRTLPERVMGWMAERMWKKGNRAGAIATMLIANGVTAVVVANNYKVASSLR